MNKLNCVRKRKVIRNKVTQQEINMSRESAVGVETGYGLQVRGVRVWSPGVGQDFIPLHVVQSFSGVHPGPIQWVGGTLSPGVKQPKREAQLSPPASDGVKNSWIYTSTHPYVFMRQCLIS
jgi:hypothetical protein